MLQSVYIENLFGLYTYTLDMEPERNHAIRFITGPNGYGKTTILNALESLFTGNFKNLLNIHFDKMQLVFDDGCSIDITQTRARDSQDGDTNSDEYLSPVDKCLDVKFSNASKEETVIWASFKGNTKKERKSISPMLAYLKAHPIYYIRDSRLKKDKSSLKVIENAEKMKKILEDCHDRINSFKFDYEVTSGPISKMQYDFKTAKLKEDIDTALSCGILDGNPLPPYTAKESDKLMYYYDRVAAYLKKEHNLLERIRAFQNIIETSDFADKHMKLDRNFGFRFVLDNEVKTILLPDSLSSGEQHTLIMFFELLFCVDDASLVLIDEPEMSFHLMWQINFSKNLRKVSSLRKLQCIVSTHSPRIFDGDFDSTVDLYEQSQAHK